MKTINYRINGGGDTGCVKIVSVFALYVIICGCLGTILWPFTINTWLEAADVAGHVSHWQGFFLGLVPGLGQFMIPAALITFIVIQFL